MRAHSHARMREKLRDDINRQMQVGEEMGIDSSSYHGRLWGTKFYTVSGLRACRTGRNRAAPSLWAGSHGRSLCPWGWHRHGWGRKVRAQRHAEWSAAARGTCGQCRRATLTADFARPLAPPAAAALHHPAPGATFRSHAPPNAVFPRARALSQARRALPSFHTPSRPFLAYLAPTPPNIPTHTDRHTSSEVNFA